MHNKATAVLILMFFENASMNDEMFVGHDLSSGAWVCDNAKL